MKVLVISDSHGAVFDWQIDSIQKQGPFDILVHCGDTYKDAHEFANKLNIETIYQVPGNCDFNVLGKELLLIECIEGKKILITHGHIQQVKSNLENLREFAKEKNVDVVLYGHTHKSQNQVIDNMLFFNPGSTVFPKDSKASYGILDIKKDKISSNIIELEN